jgi:hypothetical protein
MKQLSTPLALLGSAYVYAFGIVTSLLPSALAPPSLDLSPPDSDSPRLPRLHALL